ncbi:hypothetical protein Tco_1485379 [Tanacetum coccineum]
MNIDHLKVKFAAKLKALRMIRSYMRKKMRKQGLTNSWVIVFEQQESEGKWGTSPPAENGAGPSRDNVKRRDACILITSHSGTDLRRPLEFRPLEFRFCLMEGKTRSKMTGGGLSRLRRRQARIMSGGGRSERLMEKRMRRDQAHLGYLTKMS